jgi:hypothetical protein
MRMLVRLTIAAIMVVGAAGAASSQSSNSVVVEKLYDQIDQALANTNIDGYLSFFDPDRYVFVDEKGKSMSFVEYVEMTRKNLGNARNIDETTKIKDVQTDNGRMVAYIEQVVRFEFNDPQGKWIPMNATSTSEDTWEKKGVEWKLVSSKTLRLRSAVDAQWLADQKKIIDRWNSAIYLCNLSANGCR